MILNEEIRENMIKINNLLVDELYEICNETDISYFYDKLIYFISEYMYNMDIRKFDDVFEINDWLEDIGDLEILLEYNKKVNDDLTNSFMVKEISCDDYIINGDNFIGWFKNIWFSDDEVIFLNKFLMKTIYTTLKKDLGLDGVCYGIKKLKVL